MTVQTAGPGVPALDRPQQVPPRDDRHHRRLLGHPRGGPHPDLRAGAGFERSVNIEVKTLAEYWCVCVCVCARVCVCVRVRVCVCGGPRGGPHPERVRACGRVGCACVGTGVELCILAGPKDIYIMIER